MAKINSFEIYAHKYDEWFDKNRFIYESELRAVSRSYCQVVKMVLRLVWEVVDLLPHLLLN